MPRRHERRPSEVFPQRAFLVYYQAVLHARCHRPAAPSPEPAPPAKIPPACLPEAFDAQPARMLVRIARQSRLGDPEGCAAILALLAASRVVRADLDRVLAGLGLNEARLAALVALYAIDPESSTPAELALESQVSRVSMADTIETLHAGGWVRRKRDVRDRRTFRLELTGEGRALVQGAVRPFLATVGRSADLLTAGERLAITRACRRLRAHFQTRSL